MTEKSHILKSQTKDENNLGVRGNQKRKTIGSATIGKSSIPFMNNVLLVKGLMHKQREYKSIKRERV